MVWDEIANWTDGLCEGSGTVEKHDSQSPVGTPQDDDDDLQNEAQIIVVLYQGAHFETWVESWLAVGPQVLEYDGMPLFIPHWQCLWRPIIFSCISPSLLMSAWSQAVTQHGTWPELNCLIWSAIKTLSYFHTKLNNTRQLVNLYLYSYADIDHCFLQNFFLYGQ